MRYIVTAAMLVLAVSAQAGEIRDIELGDGSVISGEVLSLSSGIYTIKSESLGTVRIEEAKIRAIRSQAARQKTSSQSGSLTDRMMSDKDIMATIQGLQDDPDFKKILADPEIMQAVKSNDFATLLSKPEFLKLLNKPEIRNIGEKVK